MHDPTYLSALSGDLSVIHRELSRLSAGLCDRADAGHETDQERSLRHLLAATARNVGQGVRTAQDAAERAEREKIDFAVRAAGLGDPLVSERGDLRPEHAVSREHD